MLIKYSELREITDYPNEDGEYYVFEVNTETGEVVDVSKREFTTWEDDDTMTQFDGWQDIQYEIENPSWHRAYYWCAEMRLV